MENSNNGSIASQHHHDTVVNNRVNSAEQLQRQDEYLRNIDHSINTIKNDWYQQHSNRLQDNEYRRTNYYYAGNQNQDNHYQNHEINQFSKQNTSPNYLIHQFQRQMYEPLIVAQATNNYPIYRTYYHHSTNPYNSRVTFNSPLVSYRY